MTKEDVNEVYSKLCSMATVDELTKTEHIAQIRKGQHNTYKCPLCGGSLVLRTAKKGPYSGNQFYGCSNYPECRYTRNI